MNRKHLSLAVAVAAIFSVSAYAQGGGVSSGTGGVVTSSSGVVVAPSSAWSSPAPRMYPGSAVVPYNTTTVMGGPAPGITSSTTTITDSWATVPADAASRGDFQRWQSLR